MSLINDALKRARQSIQRKTPNSAPGQSSAPLQPVYAGAKASRSFDWASVKLVFLGLVVIGGVALKVWPYYRRLVQVKASVIAATQSGNTNAQVASAGTIGKTTDNLATNNNPIARAKRTFDKVHDLHAEGESNYSLVDAKPAPVAPAAVQPEASPRPEATPAVAKASDLATIGTKHKLQAIFFRESGPSALINGRSVGIGEEVDGAKVKAIARQSVTLDFAGEAKEFLLR